MREEAWWFEVCLLCSPSTALYMHSCRACRACRAYQPAEPPAQPSSPPSLSPPEGSRSAAGGLFRSHGSRCACGTRSYVADWDGGRINHKMDHLVCFLGGVLALGSYTSPGGPEGSDRARRDLELGKALTHTCYQVKGGARSKGRLQLTG